MTNSPLNPNPSLSFRLWRTYLFFGLAALLCLSNAYQTNRALRQRDQERGDLPYLFVGIKFSGLEETLGDASYIGYYTDKSLDDRLAAMQFAQAQLVLAPSILDLNNTSHEFTIFDCSSTEAALGKIRELGAQPLKINQFGIILARTKPETPNGISP